MTESTQTYTMLTTHRFDAPVEQVWNAWRDSEQVKQWWRPTSFTAPVANMDFREGGTSLICMRTPDGHDMYNTWTCQKIVPMEEIEFVQHFSDQYGNQSNPSDIGLPPDIPSEVPITSPSIPSVTAKPRWTNALKKWRHFLPIRKQTLPTIFTPKGIHHAQNYPVSVV